jgi:stress-induced morphogen
VAISGEEIVKRIQDHLPGAEVTVTDIGGGDHWSAVVIAPQFEGKSLVEQHQMVYKPLRDKMPPVDQSIHALQLKTSVPS